MKKLTLVCADGHDFAGWFASDDALAAAMSDGLIACPTCSSRSVQRGLQRPQLPPGLGKGRGNAARPGPHRGPQPAAAAREKRAAAMPPPATTEKPADREAALQRFAELYRAVQQAQAHIEQHFENVGEGFAEEARKRHYGERDPGGIYGSASAEEVSDLREEGIEVLPLPRLPKPDA